ncbi:dihydroorotate dehydrogenase [Rhizobium puerariae]|uniref:Dihydroorotate dehydrogenase n=1 Tax=Rhizobium puerariae TaxID=1585791 RepID=A0ABV6ABH3_9HYPH
MVDLSVSIGSLKLANPIMPGSGTMAEGLADIIDLDGLGAIVLKTITPDIRQGTLTPRVAEFNDATLFSIGIPSKGPDYFLNNTLPFYGRYKAPVVASVSADTVEDFGTLAAYISAPSIAAIEANISCPNLRAHGRAFGMDIEATAGVIAAMKRATDKPVWAKLTPNVGDIAAFAKAAEQAGADAIVTGNAILGMAVDAERMRPRLGNVIGGLTGSAVKPILLRMVHQCAQAVDIPIIGCGGITNGEDAVEYMLAGATAVQMGTVNFVHPGAMPEAVGWIEGYCRRHGVERVRDLTGAMSDTHAGQPKLKVTQ